jgi:acyl-[acyl-carrier-protein]-phospholipid O-acyltransferase/long-chain-fatty-acid--[acyl-carrier-protein] ligase
MQADTASTDHVWPKRPLAGLLTAQFFGAFNDNAMKLMIALIAGNLAAQAMADASSLAKEKAQQWEITVAFMVFTFPLMAFSLPSALLADRLSKRTIILAMKFLEILIMAAAAVCLFLNPVGVIPVLVVLGFMGLQSAIFSPVKYGILPEVLPHSKLSHGNGLLEMWTFLAIILGYAAGGVLLDVSGPVPGIGMSVLAVLAVVGFAAALFVPRVAPAGAAVPLREATTGAWRAIRSDRALWLTVLGSTFFWTLASLLGQDVLVYAKEVLKVDDSWAGVPYAAFGIGVGGGCVMAGRLSGHRIETGLIPIGAVGLAATTIAMGLLVPGFWITMAFMLLLGMASGFLLVPLEANLQWRAPKARRGAVIALANVPIFGGVLAGSLFAHLLSQAGFDSAQIIVICGAVTLAVTIWAIWLLPVALVRMSLVILTATFYRLRVVGREHIPEQGGALIVANHVSLVDGLFLIASTDRRVRFLVESSYFHSLWLKPVMKVLGAIPVSGGSQKEVLRALKRAGEYLEQGELVCIFAEGEISRTGAILPFRRGLERILKGRDVPVIPCHLDQVWGSVFSHRGGGFLKSLDGPIPRPVTVSFGAPLAATAGAPEVRKQVSLLGEAAWSLRSAGRRPLHHELVRKARRAPLRMALADSSGVRLNRIKALAGAIALARALRDGWRDQERVGILLPPGVACALTNFAAALSGRTSVNLNYTAGTVGLASAVRQAELRTVITARAFLDKAGVEVPDSVKPIWIEDVRPQIGLGARLLALLFASVAPKRMLERRCGAQRPVATNDIVTIIFSSGSTGEPKGVMLSHANIDANVEAAIQVLSPRRRDRLLGVLPQFHAFGYMALWFASSAGMRTVFHHNPVDAAVIGPLVEKHRITFLIATPTFLQVYTRRCSPGQFGSLRLVLTGAEKLTAKVQEAFEDRFGIRPLEGYGATECAPVIAVSTFDYRATGFYQPGQRRGHVGQALPGVAVRAVDPDTYEDLPPNTPGMLLVKGPNVMQGYLGQPELTAAAMHAGDWYVTGDIACIDEDGFIRITDRLARFSKIGGEMVPHGKVEEALHELAGATEQVFCVTGVLCGKKGEKLAVVHTCDASRIPQILEGMARRGLPNLFIPKLDQFIKVAEIPLLGTGKTDLKAVNKIAVDALGVSA